MRLSTLGSLWFVVAVGGFAQLLIGTDVPAGPKLGVLVAATVGAVVVAAASVPLLLRPSGDARPGHPLVIALVALSALVWAIALVPPFSGFGWAFTLAIAGGVLSCLVHGWWRVGAVGATYAAIAVAPLVGAGSSPVETETDLVLVGTLAVFALMPISAYWVLQVVLRLDHARQVAAELAVARERLRFATDLHDIQGHNLQVIALKSELAERLLDDEPERAAAEIADIRVIARTALDDTRAVVNDYRTVTVAVEARNAASVLRSAGIHCEVRIDAAGLPADIGAVFAVAIREAATNVLRHSGATGASIDLGQSGAGGYRLTVSNDGAREPRGTGTGLAGLARRVEAVDGTVRASRAGTTFTLVVDVPSPTAVLVSGTTS